MDVQKDFGSALRKIRTKKNISQEQFALQIGMDRTYYSSVESGKRNISLDNIKKIADGFEVALSELFAMVEDIEKVDEHIKREPFNPHLAPGQILTEKQVHDVFSCQTTLGIRMSKKNHLFVIMSGSARRKIYNDVWVGDTLYYNGTDINSDSASNQTLVTGKGNNNKQLFDVWSEPEEMKHQIFLFEKFEVNKCIYRGEVKLKEQPYLAPRSDDPTRKVWIFPLQLKNSND